MKKKWPIIFSVILVLAVGLWLERRPTNENKKSLPENWSREIVNAEDFEVLALNPISIAPSSTNTNTLLGFPILGRAKILNEADRREVFAAFSDDIAKSPGVPAACVFVPHHGIRYVAGTNKIDIAICFHCGDVLLMRNTITNYFVIKSDSFWSSPKSKKLFEKILHGSSVESGSENL